MLVRGEHDFGQIFAEKRFAARERQINRMTDVLKDARPFVERKVVVRLAPHIARPALRIASKRNADDDAKWQKFRKAETIERPVEWDLGEEGE
jgi:hypothetical protein